MKAQKFVLMLGLLFAMASTAMCLEITDDFSTDHDYLTSGVSGTVWDGFIYNGGDFATQDASVTVAKAEGGVLNLTSASGSWENEEDDGLFLYLDVQGGQDFTASMYIAEYAWVDYHDIGLMARNGASSTEDHVQHRYFTGWSVNNAIRSVDNGATTYVKTASMDAMPYIQLVKLGATFSIRGSMDGIEYTDLETIERTDLADVDLQVGIFQATYIGNSGTVALDDFRLTIPNVSYIAPTNVNEECALDSTVQWDILTDTIEYVDLYFGTDNEPNLTDGDQFKVLDMVPADIGVMEYVPTLEYDTTYYWRVDSYEPNTAPGATDYFKTTGPVWSFKTLPPIPYPYKVDPDFAAVPEAGSIDMFQGGVNIETYQWYKDGVVLVEGSKYANVTSATLTVNDFTIDDEGGYYCELGNAAGSSASQPADIMLARLTTYYDMDMIEGEGDALYIPDQVGEFNLNMAKAEDGSYPYLTDGKVGEGSLLFDNSDSTTPEAWGQFAVVDEGVAAFDDITISAWIYWNGGSSWQRIFDFGTGVSTESYMFLTPSTGGTVRFAMTKGANVEQVVDSGTILPTQEWTHVVVTLEGDTARIFINGELKGKNTSFTINPRDLTMTNNLFADAQFENDPYFRGRVDEFKIYNYALSSREIAQDYVNLIGGWVCDYEGQDDIVYDLDNDCQITLSDFAFIAQTWLGSNRVYAEVE